MMTMTFGTKSSLLMKSRLDLLLLVQDWRQNGTTYEHSIENINRIHHQGSICLIFF